MCWGSHIVIHRCGHTSHDFFFCEKVRNVHYFLAWRHCFLERRLCATCAATLKTYRTVMSVRHNRKIHIMERDLSLSDVEFRHWDSEIDYLTHHELRLKKKVARDFQEVLLRPDSVQGDLCDFFTKTFLNRGKGKTRIVPAHADDDSDKMETDSDSSGDLSHVFEDDESLDLGTP